MKQKDWLLLGGVALIAVIISLVVSNLIFGSPQEHPIKVPVVQKISPDFPSPQTDSDYQAFFNNKAIDPTQLIQIGGKVNQQPFNEGQ